MKSVLVTPTSKLRASTTLFLMLWEITSHVHTKFSKNRKMVQIINDENAARFKIFISRKESKKKSPHIILNRI